jgi:hypothetical protein
MLNSSERHNSMEEGDRATVYPGQIPLADIVSSELRDRRPRSKAVISGTLPLLPGSKSNHLGSIY